MHGNALRHEHALRLRRDRPVAAGEVAQWPRPA